VTTFYIFGESQNDTLAIAELIKARAENRKKDVRVVTLRSPLIQQRGSKSTTRKTNAEKVATAVNARIRLRQETSVVVVAHEDCDDVEPAHRKVAAHIETGLKGVGLPVVGAAPAFEMEAWWYLWPEAVAAVCGSWKRLARNNTEVGLIPNVKEVLSKDLQPGGKRVRDYSEADAPSIAKKVRSLSMIDKKSAQSASFDDFDRKISSHL
jgi:hypothetical protein